MTDDEITPGTLARLDQMNAASREGRAEMRRLEQRIMDHVMAINLKLAPFGIHYEIEDFLPRNTRPQE